MSKATINIIDHFDATQQHAPKITSTEKSRDVRLVGRLTSPFSKKIGYIRDKVSGGDLVPPG